MLAHGEDCCISGVDEDHRSVRWPAEMSDDAFIADLESRTGETRLCSGSLLVDNVYMRPPNVAHVNKETAEIADDVFELIHTVMHLFRSEQYRVLREGRYDLTHMEGKILGFFVRHPGASLRDVVLYFRQDKGQLARLIRSLKDQELLEAESDIRDRRSVPLRPTREGRSVHQILQRQVRKLSEVAIRGLSARGRRQLTALLHKVRSNLEAARDNSSTARRRKLNSARTSF